MGNPRSRVSQSSEGEAGAVALAAALHARRLERAVARRLLARERDTLASVRDVLRASTDTLVADVATDARFGLSAAGRVKRARTQLVKLVPVVTARVAAAIATGRGDARDSAREDLEAMAGRALVLPDHGVDAAHSLAAAHTLAAVWAGTVLRNIAPSSSSSSSEARGGEPSLAIAIRQAPRLIDKRAARIAATETAAAFNDERGLAIEVIQADPAFAGAGGSGGRVPRLPEFHRGGGRGGAAPQLEEGEGDGGGGDAGPYRSAPKRPPPPLPVDRLVRVWSALLDGRTCPECVWMHGTTIEAGDEFPGGDPPRHPWCRCIPVILMTSVPLDEFERAWELAA